MPGTISGYVVSCYPQQPIADVAVFVVSGPQSAPDISALTDASGHFVLDNLAPGAWTLRAVAPDGSQGEATIDVFENAATETVLISITTGA